MANPFHFPLFVDLHGKKAVVVGGGTIACRRIGVLLDFGASVTVIAPELKEPFADITWEKRPYAPGDLADAFLAVAATDDRDVNRAAGEEARGLGIPISVADCREECTFYFPAVCIGNQVVAGLVSQGDGHAKTAKAAKAVRHTLEGLE